MTPDEQPTEGEADTATGANGVDPRDMVRRLLDDARQSARDRGQLRRRRGVRPPRRRSGWSGAGPDERDPQTLGAATDSWVKNAGLLDDRQTARVFAEWPLIVGEDLALHCQPAELTEGRLLVTAESTSWATQIRLLSTALVARINDHVGPDSVKALEVRGPAAPSWVRGGRRVKGRGPRDTYG